MIIQEWAVIWIKIVLSVYKGWVWGCRICNKGQRYLRRTLVVLECVLAFHAVTLAQTAALMLVVYVGWLVVVVNHFSGFAVCRDKCTSSSSSSSLSNSWICQRKSYWLVHFHNFTSKDYSKVDGVCPVWCRLKVTDTCLWLHIHGRNESPNGVALILCDFFTFKDCLKMVIQETKVSLADKNWTFFNSSCKVFMTD